jgi:hypothetical protein
MKTFKFLYIKLSTLLKILLAGLVIGLILFLVVKEVPIAEWVAGFLSIIYDFFSEAI